MGYVNLLKGRMTQELKYFEAAHVTQAFWLHLALNRLALFIYLFF